MMYGIEHILGREDGPNHQMASLDVNIDSAEKSANRSEKDQPKEIMDQTITDM